MTQSNDKPHVHIKDWKIMPKPYFPQYQCIEGDVYGHSRFPDGHHVWTSPILNIDEQNGIVETENTIYHLEEQAV